MRIAETCPDCGAERPSWLGSSHRTKNYDTMQRHVKVCEDGESPEEYFASWTHTGLFERLGGRRWPE